MTFDIEDIKRLSLGPKDILVIKIAKRITQGQVAYLANVVPNKILVIDEDIELSILETT